MKKPKRKSYVLGFCFDQTFERVLLIQKLKPDWQRGFLNGLGGAIEPGESAPVAMRREFREECGLDVRDWYKFAVMRGSSFIVHCFVAVMPREDLGHYRSLTYETVYLVPIPLWNLTQQQPRMLDNVPWLLRMARSFTKGDAPILMIKYP